MHKTTGYLGLFVAAAISAGVAVYPSKAEAFIAYHAAQCQPICDGLAACPTAAGTGLVSSGQYQNMSNNNLDLVCPVLLMPNNDPRTVMSITVNGFANANGVDLWACRTYAAGGGGRCGTGVGTPTATVYNTAITDFSAWTSGGMQDGYFIFTDLPQTFSGSHNVIFSYYVTTAH